MDLINWLSALYLVAVAVGMTVWIWRKRDEDAPPGFWRPLGYWSFVAAFAVGAQLAARGPTSFYLGVAVLWWALLTAFAAAVLGVRHLLTRRNRGDVAR